MWKTYLAIDLADYHSKEKRWKGGKEDNVKIRVIGASTLEKAKECVKENEKNSWLVFGLNEESNIVY